MKTCKSCCTEKTLDGFRARNRNKSGKVYYHTVCRECENVKTRARHKKNYEANPQFYCARTIASKIPIRMRVIRYLKEHPCIDCSNSDIRVLEFDHRNPSEKVDAVSSMIRKGRPWQAIEKEIAKCDVRCANCHRIKTANDNDFYGYLNFGESITFEQVLEWYSNKN